MSRDIRTRFESCPERATFPKRPVKGWFLRRAAELLGTHRKVPELNPLLPFANSKHAVPVKSDVYGAGILKAEESHDS